MRPSVCCPRCNGAGRIAACTPQDLPPTPAVIYRALKASPDGLSMGRLVHAVYGERWDGGPEDAPAAIRAHVHYLNKRLAAIDERVQGKHHVYRIHRAG